MKLLLKTPNGFEREIDLQDVVAFSKDEEGCRLKLKDNRVMQLDEESYIRLKKAFDGD